MIVTFENLNNNDTDHDIVFLEHTVRASGNETITVLFDDVKHSSPVWKDVQGNRYFRWCGKRYDFEISGGYSR